MTEEYNAAEEIIAFAVRPSNGNSFRDSYEVCYIRTDEGEVFRMVDGGAPRKVWPPK